MRSRLQAVVVALGLLSGALLPCTVRAQEPAAAQAIAGTQVWLVPPAGFGSTAGFTGVRRGGAALQVLELKGSNYYRQAVGFNPARFEARGGKVLEFTQLSAGEYPAQLARVRLTPTQESAQLLFGDSTFAVLLDARYPAADTATGAALRRSLLSATYRPPANGTPPELRNTVFLLDETKSAFRLARAVGGQYTYAAAGPAGSANGSAEPVVTVSTYAYNPSITAADISQQVLSRQTGLTGYSARKMNSGKVNDLVTYETEGFAQFQGQRVLLYQQITIIGSTAVALQGIARQNVEETLAEFKRLTHTITARSK